MKGDVKSKALPTWPPSLGSQPPVVRASRIRLRILDQSLQVSVRVAIGLSYCRILPA